MDEHQSRDQALFEQLENRKKKRKKRIIRTVIIVVCCVALLLTLGVIFLQRQVRARFASSNAEAVSFEVRVGSISTSVSGSGSLTDVDLESISLPAGVEIDEVLVSANEQIAQGQVIASLNMASVMNAMADTQALLEELDQQLEDAEGDKVSSYISAGVQGRIKKIFAQRGDTVAQCIYDNGALALLSLDGYMATNLPSDSLASGDSVTVLRESGAELKGRVEKSVNGVATILVSDNGPALGEAVTVLDSEGNTLGSSSLYIHSPLSVTGITGTISSVYCYDNQYVWAGSTLFVLTDTGYSAGFEAILRERSRTEATLLELMELYRSGALCSPIAGSISSVDYDESAVTTDSETAVVTVSPDVSMSVTINVDESDIMSLQLGQSAQISVSSIGDEVFLGEVTEINKTASSSSGVTRYSAVVTLPKSEGMLPGMTASVVIRISGIDNALLIPVEALHQTSSNAYVYTSYDDATGELGGMTQVVAGISNSSYVEIISGLSEGQTVWYTETSSSFMGFGRGQMSGGGFSGGQMHGGDMPDDFGGMSGGNFGGMSGSGFGGGSERPSGGFSGSGRPSGSFGGGQQ